MNECCPGCTRDRDRDRGGIDTNIDSQTLAGPNQFIYLFIYSFTEQHLLSTFDMLGPVPVEIPHFVLLFISEIMLCIGAALGKSLETQHFSGEYS